MAVKKVTFGGNTLIDLTADTVTANDLIFGRTAHDADGLAVTGAYGLEDMSSTFDYSHDFTLADTTYSSWEASTTASSIMATENLATFTADLTQYEYFLRWIYSFEAVYESGVTLKAIPRKEFAEQWQQIYRRPSNLTNLNNNTFNGAVCGDLVAAPILMYYNTSGTSTFTYSTSYGIYPVRVAAAFSSTSSNTPTVTIKRPSVSARCYSSYFATDRKTEISTTSPFTIKGRLFRQKIGNGFSLRPFYQDIVNLAIDS